MKQDKKNKSHYTADKGKVFKRISDGLVRGSELYLGFTYYLDGKPLDEPLEEKIEHYIEIDEPEKTLKDDPGDSENKQSA